MTQYICKGCGVELPDLCIDCQEELFIKIEKQLREEATTKIIQGTIVSKRKRPDLVINEEENEPPNSRS